MWSSVVEFAAKFGPFPFGIIIGIIIMKWSFSKQLHYNQREKDAIQTEKKELLAHIVAQEKRIDALHDKVFPNH